MRKGEYRKVTVDDVTFSVVLKWGDLRRIVKEYAAVSDDDADAQVALAEKTLLDHVVGIEGYEDEKGKPITELTEKELAEFDDPDFVKRLFQAVIGSEDAGESGNS